MKKLRLILTVLFVFCLSLVVSAITPVTGLAAMRVQGSEGSGELISDTAIQTVPCYITSVLIITDGTNDAILILYDNPAAATGTVRFEMTVKGADNYGGYSWNFPKYFYTGIYGDIEGTGASFIVESIPK